MSQLEPYELIAHVKGRAWSLAEDPERGFRFQLQGPAEDDVLMVRSFWYLTRYGERFFEPLNFTIHGLSMALITYSLNSRTITDASIGDRGELRLHMADAFALIIGAPGRFLPDWPFAAAPTWEYRQGSQVLLRCPPSVDLDALRATDTIHYRFQDAPVPPDDHRSFTLVVTASRITRQIDCYGEILAEETVETPPSFIQTALMHGMECFSRSFRPPAPPMVCGGENHTLTFTRGAQTLLVASTHPAEDRVPLTGELFTLKRFLQSPFD